MPSIRFARRVLAASAVTTLVVSSLHAQAAPAATTVTGQLFANYQYSRSPSAPGQNRFDLDRAYIIVRAPAGDRMQIRITADIFQQKTAPQDAFYRGWVVRAKHAYLQYDVVRPAAPSGLAVNAGVGIVPTVLIDHTQRFWTRWIGQAMEERSGLFSSADGGAFATVTLPRSAGEIYATITNGGGYTTRETDRFKDYAARFSWTPLASGPARLIQTLTISPWYSKGERASDFVNGSGTVLPVAAGRQRDRYGVFAGIRHPRLTLGADVASTKEVAETANTLVDLTPTTTDVTGSALTAFAIVHPFRPGSSGARLGLLGRYDKVTPDKSTSVDTRFVIGGLTWDMTSNVSVALDYQEQMRDPYAVASDTKTYMLQFLANF